MNCAAAMNTADNCPYPCHDGAAWIDDFRRIVTAIEDFSV
jgi:hypothetical protein